MEWSTQEIARISGTTSRTLRYYDEIKLVTPSRIGNNGYRYYDEQALTRLQRVLLLRELGLGLSKIADVLAQQTDETTALATHLSVLEEEQTRLALQIDAIKHTINALEGEEEFMVEKMFDGFDHTKYKDEVEERWGKAAYRQTEEWWNTKTEDGKLLWKGQVAALNKDWIDAASDPNVTADSETAQEIAAKHVAWLQSVPGTPAADTQQNLRDYVHGLAEMYVSDERFAVNYGGIEGAQFVKDALIFYMK